jgi:hypothetical protein
MESKFKIPTETVELPSKGLLYPKDSPLAKGELEMKYMTAKEEDILTNQNYITKGTVIDKLLRSLIVTEGVKYEDLLVGDKNAIMIAARILSYGPDYNVMYNGENITIDLSKLDNKEIDPKNYKKGNEFTHTLPSGNEIVFKLLNHRDEVAVNRELDGLKKIDKNASPEVTTRLKHMIISINGSKEVKDIREFVDKYMLATDARDLRKEYARVQPDVNLTFKYTDEDGGEEDVDVPVGIGFFWPDSRG